MFITGFWRSRRCPPKGSSQPSHARRNRPQLLVEALEDRLCQSATMPWSLVIVEAPANDTNDHGTHVAGTVGAVSNNGTATTSSSTGRDVLIGGWGNDWISGGTGQDAAAQGSSLSPEYKYVPIRRFAT